MAINMTFSTEGIVPDTGAADVFEDGEYNFRIIDTNWKGVKGKGDEAGYMEITNQCMESGRRFVDRLNLKNTNEDTQRIARSQLAAICYCVGKPQGFQASSAELHNIPYRIRLIKEPRSDDPSKFNNSARGYMDANGNPPGQQQGAAAPTGAPPPPPQQAPPPPPQQAPPPPPQQAPPPPPQQQTPPPPQQQAPPPPPQQQTPPPSADNAPWNG